MSKRTIGLRILAVSIAALIGPGWAVPASADSRGVSGAQRTSMSQSELRTFATRYAAAWSGRNPDALASFYAENGSLTVNAGAPSVGRAAIAATAKGYMTAFPDMVVKMDSVRWEGSHATFHWTWTGTNTGPGGTGKAVRISGYEEWTLGADGLIVESKGHFDEAEYQRQLSR
jgi:steroid delta-isomerase-like uncharacterized protein